MDLNYPFYLTYLYRSNFSRLHHTFYFFPRNNAYCTAIPMPGDNLACEDGFHKGNSRCAEK